MLANDRPQGQAVVVLSDGIHNAAGATLQLANSIVAGNLNDPGSPSRDCSGTITSLGYNLVQRAQGCTLSGTTTGNVIGKDPKLGVLADNGGPTTTRMPLARFLPIRRSA